MSEQWWVGMSQAELEAAWHDMDTEADRLKARLARSTDWDDCAMYRDDLQGVLDALAGIESSLEAFTVLA